MNKKTLIVWASILAAVFIGGILVASLVVEYIYPQTATVKTIALTTYIDTIALGNNTDIVWGNLNASTAYTKNLTVQNTGNLTTTVYLIITGLPMGWTETWSATNGSILNPNESVVGVLTLTVSANASGSYSWSSRVRGEQT